MRSYNLAKRTWYNWHRNHNIIQSLNFVLGLILVTVAFVVLISVEKLGASNSQMNTSILGLCGVPALWSGVTDNKRIVYIIDMLLGLIFISSSAGIAFLNGNATRSDVVFGVSAGLVFLITAYGGRQSRQKSKIQNNHQLIEDFKP